MPTRRAIITLTTACRAITGEDVTPETLFERSELLLHSARHRLSEFHARDLAALDTAIKGTNAEALREAIATTNANSETAVLYLLHTARRMIDREPLMAAEIFAAAMLTSTSLRDSSRELVASLAGEALKGRANALRQLGDFSSALTDLHTAARQFAAARFCAREAGGVEYTRAIVYLSMEARDEAAKAARAARKHFLDAHDTRRAAHVGIVEAGIYFERGDTDVARTMFLELRKILGDTRDHDALARVWLNLGACEIRRGDKTAARHWLTRASGGFRRLGNQTELLRTQWNMATFLARFSNRQRGIRLLERVERAFAHLKMHADEACVGVDILELLVEDDAPLGALSERGRRVAAALIRMGMRSSASQALYILQAIHSRGDARAAVNTTREELRGLAVCGVVNEAGGAADFTDPQIS
ncbi:MAG: hypothetical protein JWO97_3314 [Acidobacteria bacterium]|nr:hypothetical protein [Acidobacteriota bacterium]